MEWDYGNGYPHRQNNSGTCNHPKISHLFIVYVHHSPVFGPGGEKISHTTDVWTFWADDSDEHDGTKDCFYVVGSIDIIVKYYTEEAKVVPMEPTPEVHGWMDGCGEQNKGRRTFRMFTEFVEKHGGMRVYMNFAATNHFGGQWDADGGRQCARCYRSELDASNSTGTGRILPTTRSCMELLEEEMTLTQKGKRVEAGGKQHENKNYTINKLLSLLGQRQQDPPCWWCKGGGLHSRYTLALLLCGVVWPGSHVASAVQLLLQALLEGGMGAVRV
jgi:hypothetical protein